MKRFARDTEFHFKLRRAFQERGAKIECLNFNFEDTPEGKFMETIFAAQGELEREQNRRQVIQKMSARLQKGYWVFQAPTGYRFTADRLHGKIMVRKEPDAAIIQEALEGFASGRFQSPVEVKRFLETKPIFPSRHANGEIRHWQVSRLLTNVLYAGYLEVPNWNIGRVAAQHEALIDLRTYQRIQDRLEGRFLAPARKVVHNDFPLRGFVDCADCGHGITSCWSQGKYQKYPYYICQHRGCPSKGRSIPRDRFESEFEEILRDVQPAEGLFKVASAMFRDAWNARLVQSKEIANAYAEQMTACERKIEHLVSRIVEAQSPTVVRAYEERIAALERENIWLQRSSRQ